MNTDRLPDSLLNGESLHCRPVEGGSTVEAAIIRPEGKLITTFKVAIICPARIARSKCQLRVGGQGGNGYCLYYKGDSRGSYQIVGPNTEKSDMGWK